MFWRNYRNTVEYTVVATAIAMALTTTYAYALSKHHLKGRKFFIGVAVATMFFNGGLIPNYILISQLGFRNTLWAIVLPNAISIFNLLVMKSFFENFPSELEEAASIDGMSTYGVFFKVVLPLSKAVVATMLLFYAVSFWNGWFGAFLYMDDPNLYPVTVYLRNLMAGVTSAPRSRAAATDNMTQIGGQRAVRDDAPHGPAHHLPLPVPPEVLRVGRDARRGEAVTPTHHFSTRRIMRSTRKRVGAAASVAVLALTLTAACSSGGDPADEPSASSSGIPDAQRVGAMDDFAVGTEFVATEPVEFGVLYRDHPNYPLNEDWLFFSHLAENNKVSFDLTSAPLCGLGRQEVARSSARATPRTSSP